MTRSSSRYVGQVLLNAILALAITFGGCRASFTITHDELARARVLPPDAAVRAFEGSTAVLLRAGAVKRSIAVSSRGDRLVEDPGIDLRRAAWGVGGTAIGFVLVSLPIAGITSAEFDSTPVLVSTLITVALTGLAIGFGIQGDLVEDEYLYSDQPLIESDPPLNRGLDVDAERRLKAEAALGSEGE